MPQFYDMATATYTAHRALPKSTLIRQIIEHYNLLTSDSFMETNHIYSIDTLALDLKIIQCLICIFMLFFF